MNDFVHLHLHTDYSLLDGANNIDKLVPRAKELDMKCLSITDHGNMFGVIEFYEKCVNNGIKPIIGQEFYIALDKMSDKKDRQEQIYHLVLLAENEVGYKNLMKLSSEGFINGFRYKPRIDKTILREHSKGLIALSACRKGEVQHKIVEHDIEGAKAVAQEYLDIFGNDRYYFELMRIGMSDDEMIISEQLKIAKELKISYVATNDVHYLTKDDYEMQEVLLCLQTGCNLNDEKRMRFPSKEFYLKSNEEMTKLFSDIPEAIENSVKIASMCNLSIDISKKNFKMPKVAIPEGFKDEITYLEEIVKTGLKKHFGANPSKEIRDRIEYELATVKKMNFAGYFIIIYNLIETAKEHNIPVGPGRGSAAGSIILFLLGVTKANPLDYGLFFERFLNPERVSMPDVDIDISDRDRDKLIKLLIEQYGTANVAQIAAFNNLKTRQVFTDVARVFDLPPAEVKFITKMLPADKPLCESRESIANWDDIVRKTPVYEKVMSLSLMLEENKRHVSKHAAGIVITPGPLTDYVPIWKQSEDDTTYVTQFEKNSIEKIGLVKIDVLGLTTLSIIDDTLKFLKEKGIEIDLDSLPYTDEKTYKLLREAKTNGVFQLESSGMKDLLRRYQPESFSDIINIIAFYRPGPMGPEEKESIIKRKHKKEEIVYPHPKLENALKETFGHIIFQEQVMQIVNVIGGFTFAEADHIRKAMSKKNEQTMSKYESQFIQGALKEGMAKEKAYELYDKVSKFAGYGFNKSHATTYAMLSYQTAYLKTHYPIEFMAAVINSCIGSIKDVVRYIDEAKNMGIPINPPDINASQFMLAVEGDSLRLGLGIIKNVGESAVREIIANRKNSLYESFYDFLLRNQTMAVNKKCTESMLKAGVFDSLKIKRDTLYENYPSLIGGIANKVKDELSGQTGLFGEIESDDWTSLLKSTKTWDKETLLNYEREVLEFYLSGHPLEKEREIYRSVMKYTLEEINEIQNDVEVTLAGIITHIEKKKSKQGSNYANFRIFTFEGYVDATMFSKKIDEFGKIFYEDTLAVFIGKISKNDPNSAAKIIIDKIITFEKMRDFIEGIEVEINLSSFENGSLDSLKEVLESFNGTNALFFKIKKGDQSIKIKSQKYKISGNNETFRRLQEIFGQDSVKYIFRRSN